MKAPSRRRNATRGTDVKGGLRLKDFRGRLLRRAKRAGVEVPAGALDPLERYFSILQRWNEKMNLVSFRTPDEAIDRLLVEPLAAARVLQGGGDMALLDVGSGGGSPAIPLKIAAPAARLVMVEAKARKAAFLREAVRELGFTDVRVETARFEELLSRPDLHEALDVVTIRAVRVEGRVLTGLQAFLRPGGRLFWFRSGGTDGAEDLTPLLSWEATYPLIEATRSRLVVLAKARVGMHGVSRGTRV